MSDSRKMFYGAPPEIFKRAKSLRLNTTKHEKLLWEKLGSNKMKGLRFKRQHPVSRYIVDIYCHKLKLVIEIDGLYHNQKEQRAYDQNRTLVLQEFGITVNSVHKRAN